MLSPVYITSSAKAPPLELSRSERLSVAMKSDSSFSAHRQVSVRIALIINQIKAGV